MMHVDAKNSNPWGNFCLKQSTDIKLVVWIGGLELVARPFFCCCFFFIFNFNIILNYLKKKTYLTGGKRNRSIFTIESFQRFFFLQVVYSMVKTYFFHINAPSIRRVGAYFEISSISILLQ